MGSLLLSILLAVVPPWVSGAWGHPSSGEDQSADVYYIMSGDTLYVRGAVSATKDIAQQYVLVAGSNQSVEWNDTYIIPPSAPHTLAGMRSGPVFNGGMDDAPPIQTDNGIGYLGGNHGLLCAVVTSTSDKTASDIGSLWRDSAGYYFFLAGVAGTGTQTLTFYSRPVYSTPGAWTMRYVVTTPLAHVYNATNTASISVTSQTATGKFPVVANLSRSLLRNGVTAIADGGSGYAGYVDLVEEYDLMNPAYIDTTQTSNPWVWNLSDSVWAHVKNTYRATAGCTAIHSEYTFVSVCNLKNVAGLQCEAFTSGTYANQYYYIPKVANSTRAATVYAWQDKQPLNSSALAFYFRPESLLVSGNPPDRATVYFEASGDTNYSAAFSAGYTMEGDAVPAKRYATPSTGNYMIVGAKKLHYRIDDGIGPIPRSGVSGSYNIYAYRQWSDAKQFPREKMAYWNSASGAGYDYVYIDYHNSVTNDATVLPERMWGKTVAVVDTLNVYNISATVPATGILISTTASDTLGYAVLRLQ